MTWNSNSLTAIKVAKLTTPGRYSDGNGLVLQISKWRTKSWLFRFQRDGRERQMGLGSVSFVSLAEAREKARECRKALLLGLDPIEVRDSERAQAELSVARTVTFSQCAERYVAAHEAAWKNEKHRAQWRSTIKTYVEPIIGNIPVNKIDFALVLKCIEPIWLTKPETAKRVRGRIEHVLDWAKVRGYRDGENPARWKGHLDKQLPSPRKVRPVKHHPALPYSEIPAFMADLRARKGSSARALEFAILTATRTGEIIGARWSEIDIKSRIWTVPAARMKAGRDHRVPLSSPTVKILSDQPRDSEFVFSSVGGEGSKLSNMALLTLMRKIRSGYVPHGFRSTFRDWAAEETSYPNHVAEMALSHTIGDQVEAAYRRGDLFEKRRQLMDAWARYCGTKAQHKSGNVVALRGRK